MPEMENLDNLFVLVDAVVNANRRMHKLANFGQSRNRCTQARKDLEKFDVVKERCPKAFGCARIICADVIENGC